jgi:hypothetical protein
MVHYVPKYLLCTCFCCYRLFLSTFIHPKWRFGMDLQKMNPDFEGSPFQGREYSIWATKHWKVYRKSGFHLLSILPKSSFGEHRFITTWISGWCWNRHFRFRSCMLHWRACQPVLKSVHAMTLWRPNEDLEGRKTVRNIFSTHFSRTWVLDLG